MTLEVSRYDGFPVITGDLEQDTGRIIESIRVGTREVEAGMAALYLVYKRKEYLSAMQEYKACSACGFEPILETDKACPRCGGVAVIGQRPMFPTLESYIQYVANESGQSRQTLFNRIKIYRILSDESGVDMNIIFALNMLSSGAGKLLADAIDSGEDIRLLNGNVTETVARALDADSKSEAVAYIRHDVLGRPRFSAEDEGDGIHLIVYKEDYSDTEPRIENKRVHLVGDWDEESKNWIKSKLGIRP